MAIAINQMKRLLPSFFTLVFWVGLISLHVVAGLAEGRNQHKLEILFSFCVWGVNLSIEFLTTPLTYQNLWVKSVSGRHPLSGLIRTQYKPAGVGTLAEWGTTATFITTGSREPATTQTRMPRQRPRHKDRLTLPSTQYHRGSAAAKLVTSRPIPCILMMGNPMMQVLLVSPCSSSCILLCVVTDPS